MSNYKQVSVIPDTEIYYDNLYSSSDYAVKPEHASAVSFVEKPALAAQSNSHIAYADPSAIRLTDYPSSESEQESETQPTSQVNKWRVYFRTSVNM
jgi:hypothetical protein